MRIAHFQPTSIPDVIRQQRDCRQSAGNRGDGYLSWRAEEADFHTGLIDLNHSYTAHGEDGRLSGFLITLPLSHSPRLRHPKSPDLHHLPALFSETELEGCQWHQLALGQISVHPSARRLGVGRVLYQHFLRHNHHYRYRLATVNEDNPASRAFHHKLGYRELGTVPSSCEPEKATLVMVLGLE